MKVSDILDPWGAVHAALGLAAPIRDDAHHAEMLAFVDECFERFGADDAHPVFTLVALVADRIRAYEKRTHPWPERSTPASRLAFLMEQHGLRQCLEPIHVKRDSRVTLGASFNERNVPAQTIRL